MASASMRLLLSRSIRRSQILKQCSRASSIFSHGNGLYGGLGQGHYEVVNTPTEIKTLDDKHVKSVASGWAHSAALTTDGEVFVWGQPYELLKVQRVYRQQVRYGFNWAKKWNDFVSSFSKHGGPSGYIHPVQMQGLPSYEKVIQIECGVGLTAILCESGSLYMFGMNDFGQCGVGTNIERTNIKERTIYNPSRPTGLLNPLPLDFNVDEYNNEYVYNDKYRKGTTNGEEHADHMLKELLRNTLPWKGQEVIDVSLGYSHGAVITSGGGILTWGKGLRGQLGNGKTNDMSSPSRCLLEQDIDSSTLFNPEKERERGFTKPTSSSSSPIPISISCGATHTACLTQNGEVYVWGKFQSSDIKEDEYEGPIREMMKQNREGKPIYHDQLRPRKAILPHNEKAIQIACSAYHTAILLESGKVYVMGVKIGSGEIISQPIPFTVRVEKNNELGVGWDASFSEDIEISDLIKESGEDLGSTVTVSSIKGGSSANCTAIITSQGEVFTVFFCDDEKDVLENMDLEDSTLCTIPEPWQPPNHEQGQKVVDVAIGWQHTLIATTK